MILSSAGYALLQSGGNILTEVTGTVKCERCRRKQATIHLTEIIREVKAELHLCEACARDFGLDSRLGSLSLSIPDIVSYLEPGAENGLQGQVYCHSCGSGLDDIQQSGMAGCDDCYRYLEKGLASVLARAGGGQAGYAGKIPLNARHSADEVRESMPVWGSGDTLADLRQQLARAVEAENYEQAARLRDLIKEQDGVCGREN